MSGIASVPLFQSHCCWNWTGLFQMQRWIFSLHNNVHVTTFVFHGGSGTGLQAWQTGSWGTCLAKAIDLETDRSKAVLSGRRRVKRYMTRQILRRENNFWETETERWGSLAGNSWKVDHRKVAWTREGQPREPHSWNAEAHWREETHEMLFQAE